MLGRAGIGEPTLAGVCRVSERKFREITRPLVGLMVSGRRGIRDGPEIALGPQRATSQAVSVKRKGKERISQLTHRNQ